MQPPGDVTTTGTTPGEPAGVRNDTEVASPVKTSAWFAPNLTVIPGTKFVPRIVVTSPPRLVPAGGLIDEMAMPGLKTLVAECPSRFCTCSCELHGSPAGQANVASVAVRVSRGAGTPLTLKRSPSRNPVPMIVTVCPCSGLNGDTVLMVGAGGSRKSRSIAFVTPSCSGLDEVTTTACSVMSSTNGIAPVGSWIV